VLLDWHRVVHEIEYLVKGFLRVVLESNVMPSILGDQLSKSHELAPKKQLSGMFGRPQRACVDDVASSAALASR
jgi:hypothetical protein